jgi:hypothetical protein
VNEIPRIHDEEEQALKKNTIKKKNINKYNPRNGTELTAAIYIYN